MKRWCRSGDVAGGSGGDVTMVGMKGDMGKRKKRFRIGWYKRERELDICMYNI